MKTLLRFRWILPLVALALCGAGEEKNGLRVTVTKATLTRGDQRGADVNSELIDRTQGIKVVITNITFKDAPEGQVEWQILVRKHGTTSVEIYTGTEKLKTLRRAESAELTLGAVPISGVRDGASMMVDKIEWHISIKQGSSEIYSASSFPGFAALAKRAVPGAGEAVNQ